MTKARDIASAIPAPSTVDATELGYLDGVTSAIQTQIDAKAPSSTAVTLTGTQTLTNKTLTNPVIASVVNNTLTSTTGDMIYASAANTPARLGIGSSAQVLTVSGGIPSWATPAAPGGMTLINSGGTTLSGSSVTIGSIPATYKNLQLIVRNFRPSDDNRRISLRFNSDTTASRHSSTNEVLLENQNFNDSYVDISYGQDNGTSYSLIGVDIYDYANAATWKMGFQYGLTQNATTATNLNLRKTQIFYNQTGAITALDLFVSSGTFTSGTAYLYGVA